MLHEGLKKQCYHRLTVIYMSCNLLKTPKLAVSTKKHLNFDALRNSLSDHFSSLPDDRVLSRCQHSLHDAMMSAFACMFFQDSSLVSFQRDVQESHNDNNLHSIFKVDTIPKDSQLRDLVDGVSSELLRPVFKNFFYRLQRAKQLSSFQVLPNLYMCAIDGVYHHSSEHVHCPQCLTKKHKNGSVTYSHGVLQGAFMHSEQRQVIPVMPEPIANSAKGFQKQDCEVNAAKRFIIHLKNDHPRLDMMIVGDGLFSKAPMVNCVLEQQMHFLFVAKPDDHQYMMQWLDGFDTLPKLNTGDLRGRKHHYSYQNRVPLNGKEDAPLVNYIHYELENEKGKVTYKNSWVTDIEVSDDNVIQLTQAGRCRWKIENECFNTLKNQGYHLNHNFGHGKKNLSHNMYLLTLLAFFFHQIFELCDPNYQLARKAFVNKQSLWQSFRVLMTYFVFSSWRDAFGKLLKGRANAIARLKNK